MYKNKVSVRCIGLSGSVLFAYKFSSFGWKAGALIKSDCFFDIHVV